MKENLPTYDDIVEAVQLDLDEYVNEDGLTIAQASAKILEEEWQDINEDECVKYSYLLTLALDGIKQKQLSDFLYDKLEFYGNNILKMDNNESSQLKQDFLTYQEKLKEQNFDMIETNVNTKSRVDYILNQNQ
ncbi:hypothetical protein UAY_00264 [Enterococcus moraviensis ATCC BAA-383]|uniref:Uncharacterized protein n=1 Tax=Enterococcus moraviensis ATCC BAA-383 TaxID=1158609 RepID=R2U2G3_9ENTE|nr:hypothetical protein [Enterococcus moraviensis]EOI06922.1 hypothetical protein UAY_00264 [Enterococcus moraviensis ATCC BAA-383]EOT65264.1 hypothetical protein I586_02998 [Enterococcus moraviensis ATCC BAA-383]OJG66849.1 hypothetical protein RV09_GL003318 [Enterococcus moraviensis]